ncbi:histidine kinase, partial [Salmonella enterica]|nr:histidine kinase [Salmonella enterica]
MVISAAFQTRARTIDHLGREQIADCPTAISELWKNAYDAYARNVSLNIFDGDTPVATLVDDGHGMSLDDIINKWLTVGTESKAIKKDIPYEDRNGIDHIRAKQGQKGIGRLSCAALGSLMLLVSKKKDSPLVACLLDWRIFENPYLMLNDIKIPIMECSDKNELITVIPEMFDALMGNLWGDGDDILRDNRIEQAWENYSELEKNENNDITKEAIENTVINAFFEERHFQSWPVWNNKTTHGTAMFIAGIHDDLIAQLSTDAGSEAQGAEVRAKERFLQTLNSFVNPFKREEEEQITDFKTSVIAWNGNLQRFIIDEVRNFDISNFDQLEHIVEGNIDENGLFSGRVKAFGEWFDNITVKPKTVYKTRKDTRFGPFFLRLGTFEVIRKNSTLSDEQHATFDRIRDQFGGVMVFRDDLRVMPYGREDNDFFEIEKRRSKNAGLYMFSNRACFGGVYITKEHNPNLRDKAGREGIIDNKASKLFREIVENILIEIAKRFIGRASNIRDEKLEEINAKHAALKADEDRKKLLRKEQRRVKTSIQRDRISLEHLRNEFYEISQLLSDKNNFKELEELLQLKENIDVLDGTLKNLSLGSVPRNLGSIEKDYRQYRDLEIDAKSLLKQINNSVYLALDHFTVKDDYSIAEKDFRSKAAILHAKIRKFSNKGRNILKEETLRFEEITNNTNKAFHEKTSQYLSDLQENRTSLKKTLENLDLAYQIQDIEISQTYAPYITALESLREEIDLEGLAISSVNENTRLKKQVEQVNALAQLGITVEIIGHEIEGFDMTIERGINRLSSTNLDEYQKNALSSITQAHQSLSDSWRFLSPLKLSGDKVRAFLSGKDIFDYVNHFFNIKFEKDSIEFSCSTNFLDISLYDQPARIYPVFINLVNNSRYWVKETKEERRIIRLDVLDGLIYVSDNGPGVDPDDVSEL